LSFQVVPNVPVSFPPPAETAPQRNVLLLEGYDALAAALGSALKKFAPEHTISVAASLGQAEDLAAKSPLDLFVIDADPPWQGITDFLEKMRAVYPNARAIVIGAAIPGAIAAERRFSGALQFIEKPFELAAFGAAVQALLGPWQESDSTGPRGNLAGLNSIDLLLLHHAAEANVIVDLSAGPNDSGEIHIAAGQVSHAETGTLTGLEALRKMLSWPEARISERKVAAVRRRGVQRGWVSLVLEVLRSRQPTKMPVKIAIEEAAAPKPRAKTGKKIVVIDDTEMLLVFVEDVLAIGDPELQISTARTGIEGLKKIQEIVPDLALLDYSLPDLNGDEICRRLLQDERTAAIPVLMMSAHGPEMSAAAKRLVNVVATIEKPFFSNALVQLVQRNLSEPRPPRQVKPPPPIQIAPTAPVAQRAEKILPKPTNVRIQPVAATETVLSLYLEVVSMQFTPQLEMGSIRARPASATVSLRLPTAAAKDAILRETGFQLGATELNASGGISMMRLVPNSKPFQPAQTRTAFQIGSVALVPSNTRQRVQLTTAGSTPMMLQVIMHLELAGVKLSPTFQVAELILKWRKNTVRVTLDPKAPEESGAIFEMSAVQLDNFARVSELLLNPVK
jgi:DNA-binding response OmpR family regulator